MSKPIRKVEIETAEGIRSEVDALVDLGSFDSLIREDCVPPGASIFRFKTPSSYGTAAKGGRLGAVGKIYLMVTLEGHPIDLHATVCPDLSGQLIIGAGIMQMWDISIQNDNGHTKVIVGRDRNDPDIQTVL